MKLNDSALYAATIDTKAIDSLLSIINTGRAMLFVGAGFSVGCKNLDRKSPPLAKDLAILICKKGEFQEDDDLSYVADYFMTYKDRHELLDILKKQYTILSCKKEHEKVSALKWKRIYTTNYDDAIEKSAANIGKNIYSLTADDSPKEFYKKKNCCIHINGSICQISESDLDSKIKLTRTSYVSPDTFVNSPWYYYFKKDLEQSSAVVFIGYSLYDIDIERILFSSPFLKEKTYFIIRQNPSPKELFVLSKYGSVLPIGIECFSEKINVKLSKNDKDCDFWTDAFLQYNISDQNDEISDDEVSDDQILNFILYGDLKNEYIDRAILAKQNKPFLIVRKNIYDLEKINSSNCVSVLSDFGNGKTVFLREAMSHFSKNGKKVFFLHNPDGDYMQDIEKINNLNTEALIFIDDYSLHIDILLYILKFNSKFLKVIFSDRTNNHEHLRNRIIKENKHIVEINVDLLQNGEVEHFVSIIDNLGYWGEEKANLPIERKAELIRSDDRGQISNILLSLFNSPQIKQRISSLISPIINNTKYKDVIFSICLLQIINLPRSLSLISEVADNDFIYKSELRVNDYFNQLFRIGSNEVFSKSSIFSISLIQNFFSSAYVTSKLLNIAEKFNKLHRNGDVEKELFKSLLRFSFIERLLPGQGKLNSFIKYYEELKIRVNWLQHDPHFWLQYGMARMSYGELDKAQSNLDEAYAYAHNKKYDTLYIDTQQARLYLLRAIEEKNESNTWSLFQKAHNILVGMDDNIYKYRQVSIYRDFYNKKYKMLSTEKKYIFHESVKKLKVSIEKSQHKNVFTDHVTATCYKYLSEITNELQK